MPIVVKFKFLGSVTFVCVWQMIYFYFQGTEVKAITYSNMQIYDGEKHEVFVIIDI